MNRGHRILGNLQTWAVVAALFAAAGADCLIDGAPSRSVVIPADQWATPVPFVVTAIDDLELAARLVVEGVRAGSHRSPFHGYSSEFQLHRPYRAGDDLKYLDWKVLARTDRLYTRQFRETTSMSVMLVLDGSASMAFPETGTSKWRYAAVLAASLAHLVVSQGDAVGLLAMTNARMTYVPARGGRPHLRSLIATLERLEPSGTWSPAQGIARGAELLKRRGVVIVLSDFQDVQESTHRELRRIASHGHDVAMLQVVAPDEFTFPYRGDLDFEDLETGERRLLDAGAIAANYRQAFEQFMARSRAGALSNHIDYALMSTDAPPGDALRINMQVLDGESCDFDATLVLQRHPADARWLSRCLWRYPLMTLRVVLGIHWQAFLIWLARNPVYDHPRKVSGTPP